MSLKLFWNNFRRGYMWNESISAFYFTYNRGLKAPLPCTTAVERGPRADPSDHLCMKSCVHTTKQRYAQHMHGFTETYRSCRYLSTAIPSVAGPSPASHIMLTRYFTVCSVSASGRIYSLCRLSHVRKLDPALDGFINELQFANRLSS